MSRLRTAASAAGMSVLLTTGLTVTASSPAQAAPAITRKCSVKAANSRLYATVRVYNSNARTRMVKVNWTKKRIVWVGVVPIPVPARSVDIWKSGYWAGGGHPAYFSTDNKARYIRMNWKISMPGRPDPQKHCGVTIPKRVW